MFSQHYKDDVLKSSLQIIILKKKIIWYVFFLCKKYVYFSTLLTNEISCFRTFFVMLESKCTSNSLWWLEISVGRMPKNSCFLLKAHSAHWDTFVWMWYAEGLLFLFTLNFQRFLLFQTTYTHAAMVTWNLSQREYIGSNCVGMPSFVDNWKLLDLTQEVNKSPVLSHMF